MSECRISATKLKYCNKLIINYLKTNGRVLKSAATFFN